MLENKNGIYEKLCLGSCKWGYRFKIPYLINLQILSLTIFLGLLKKLYDTHTVKIYHHSQLWIFIK